MTVPASEPTPGCSCAGRAQGRHNMLCEHILRGAFGSVADAPEDVKAPMRAKGQLAAGTVIAGEPEEADDQPGE